MLIQILQGKYHKTVTFPSGVFEMLHIWGLGGIRLCNFLIFICPSNTTEQVIFQIEVLLLEKWEIKIKERNIGM